MPRIDPKELLTCLSILLSSDGGILSQDEVPRLVNLMTKFSKKLVSKCVYILILKQTEQVLVDLFMSEGGWNLVHMWLQDAINGSNYSFVYEILSLLLVTPVDVERLKLNNIPKLIKQLSRHDDVEVQELSSQLVHDWLVLVRGNVKPDASKHQTITIDPPHAQPDNEVDAVAVAHKNTTNKADCAPTEIVENISSEQAALASPFYKVTLRDGKQVISRTASVDDPSPSDEAPPTEEIVPSEQDPEKSGNDDRLKEEKLKSNDKVNDKSKSKERSSSSKHSSSKHRSSSSSHKSSSRDKDRHKSGSSSRSSSSSGSKHKKDRDKHRENGSSSSSSKDKTESKEKQAEKDKDTLAKLKPQSIDRLGRIPKKTDDKTKEVKEPKKPTMSIEVRKSSEDRPKTVKVFNSKRRSTGLEEELKPPPPRVIKKPPPVLPPTLPQKRPSPTRDSQSLPPPPEKKLKMDIPERPGSIKLIPPKPKPQVLQESDIFMDALTAASAKKEPKKRKRRPSVTKDAPETPTTPTETTPSSPVSSPIGLKNIAAPNFYQDTLETEDKTEKEDSKEEATERATTPVEGQEVEKMQTDNGLKGVLLYSKKKGPKKSVKFNDGNLTQVRFFELDETERVNVTRTFMDMAKMEMSGERHALQMSRKLPTEDTMEPQTMWRELYIIDQKDPLIMSGCKSKERDVQFAREKDVPQVFYYDRRLVPDSPQEPIPENHPMKDPINIPLEDSETQEMDKRSTPWPEPKGSPPHIEDNIPPQIFPNMPMQFPNFSHTAPPNFHQNMAPRFGPPGGPGVFGGPPNIMGPPNGNMMGPPNGNMMGPPPNLIPPAEMMHQGPPVNPHGFGPPDNFNPMMNDNSYQMPYNPPPNMGMYPPNNFNMNRGGNRGGFRRGGNNNGPWIRMNGPGPGPGNWNNRGGGGGNRGGRLCKNVKNHGFCRNIDNCPFIHPK